MENGSPLGIIILIAFVFIIIGIISKGNSKGGSGGGDDPNRRGGHDLDPFD